MATGVVSIGRWKYAVGLYWENSPSGHIAQAAKESAQQSTTPVEYYVSRPGNDQGRVPQFGLAPYHTGFTSGMPSLAGCLAMQQPGSWIGAFKFSEGYAVIIVRDDLVVPDGDVFYDIEGDARDRFLEEIAIGGFQRIFAPESWGISGADVIPLSLLLNENTKIRLRSLALSAKTKLILAVSAIVLLSVAGIGFYIQAENERQEAEMRRQMEAMEAARRAAQRLVPGLTKPNYPPPERKWEKHPRPMDVVEACMKALEEVPAASAGWEFATIVCSETNLLVSWRKTQGLTVPPAGAKIDSMGDVASRTFPYETLDPRGAEALISGEDVVRRYLRQNWTGTMKRGDQDPLPPPPANYHGEWNPPPPPWIKRSFTLSVPVLPWTIPLFIGDLPGTVIRSMTSSGKNGKWVITGEIYENRS